ncbi:MAG TPA: universal stress protein [Terracidiphilus sp.]|nr:universal stress protein [Terracidiphilus sp.]
MSDKLLRRWCSPKTILVVMRPSDDPAQVLSAIQYAEMSGAKMLLVQLSAGYMPPGSGETSERICSPRGPIHESPQSDVGRTLLSAEVLKRAFVLKEVRVQQLPTVVRTFNIDWVAVTQARGFERAVYPALEERLMSAMNVPVWILGRGMSLNLATPTATHRILVPVEDSPELEFSLKFARKLAESQHATLSVLHVFDGSEESSSAKERSPFTVKSWLRLSSLRLSSTHCPIEISIRQGDPATEILEFNARRPHDLVVLRRSSDRHGGSHSHSRIVSRLCSELPCPVLVLGNAIEAPQPRPLNLPTAHGHRIRLRTAPLGMEG